MNTIHSEGQAPADWDKSIEKAGRSAGICQSSFWANFVTKLDNAKAHFLQTEKEGKPIASLLIFHKMRTRVLTSDWLQWHFGPAFFVDDPPEVSQAVRSLAFWIDEYAGLNNINRVNGLFPRAASPAQSTKIAQEFTQLGFTVKQWASCLIDLTKDQESLWRGLEPAARKSVKKAERAELTVEQIKDQDVFVKDFLGSYLAFEKAAGRRTRPAERMTTLWELDGGRYYHFFVARSKEGEVLATLGMHFFNGVATEIASSISAPAFEKKLPAQDLLHWVMILAAKAQGCHTFDLAGVSPDPLDSKSAGIRRFKEKWGGKYIEYPRVSKQYKTTLLDRLLKLKTNR